MILEVNKDILLSEVFYSLECAYCRLFIDKLEGYDDSFSETIFKTRCKNQSYFYSSSTCVFCRKYLRCAGTRVLFKKLDFRILK